jgi:hypothetical protein
MPENRPFPSVEKRAISCSRDFCTAFIPVMGLSPHMKCPMKILAVLVCVTILSVKSGAEPLSPADREALLESLEKLKDDAEGKVAARFRAAVMAYRAALASEDETLDFYLKCVEKVNFQDQQRKAADFRDWKRRESDRLSSGEFRMALRAQLRWLVIYLQSADENADRAALAADGQAIVDAVFENPERLATHQETLSQPVTATVFARAYEVGGLEKVKWPQSPVQLEQFYEQVVFPLYRRPSGIESLRSAWLRRIRQETVRAEAGVENHEGGGRRNGGNGGPQRPADASRFIIETLPELKWQMEVDLFQNGDESGAAKRMLEHIMGNITHRSARGWSEQFKNLLAPPAATSPPAGDGAETGKPGA